MRTPQNTSCVLGRRVGTLDGRACYTVFEGISGKAVGLFEQGARSGGALGTNPEGGGEIDCRGMDDINGS